MSGASMGLHEEKEKLKPETIERHRAYISIIEELEAADWYDQRADATEDAELRAILQHNRDEEKEHAAITLEWLRRRDPKLDEQLRTYLFTEGDLLSLEGNSATSNSPVESHFNDGSLKIGSLKGGASL